MIDNMEKAKSKRGEAFMSACRILSGTDKPEDKHKVTKEALEVAKVVLDTRKAMDTISRTPANEEFMDMVNRMVDSLKSAEIEQVDFDKRERAIAQCLSRLGRYLTELGVKTDLTGAVQVRC